MIQWLGVTNDYDLDKILPNRKSFPGMILSRQDVFAEKRWTPLADCKDEGKEVVCIPREINTDDDNIYNDDYRTDDYEEGGLLDNNNTHVVILSTVIPVLVLLAAAGGLYYFVYVRPDNASYKIFGDDDDDLSMEDNTLLNMSGDSDLSTMEESKCFNFFYYRNNSGIEIATK